MINFHLQFPIPAFENKISYRQKIVFIGSCFAENIGNLFLQNKLNVFTNSHGIQYNPWSIVNSLNKCLLNIPFNENELFLKNDQWNSWEHHSKFSGSTKEECLQKIKQQLILGYNYLISADWLIITVGSSFVYKHQETKQFVSNCHKVDQKYFSKELLSSQETISLFNDLIIQLKEKNKNLKIIFTVSPVRYIRDGIIENNVSKARLIDAIHSLVHRFENCFYFPAYELIMDDLRDYRFFKPDLVHPNEQAIDYVFNKFIEATVDNESKIIIEKIKEIVIAKNHRPSNASSDSYTTFKKTFANKCSILKKEYPFLDLSEESDFFNN